jgi:hypothetical protein
MGEHRPDYLNHVEVRRQSAGRTDHTAVVVLLPTGRAQIPQPDQLGLAQVPPDRELPLGWVTPHQTDPGRGRRTRVTVWRFTCRGQPDGRSGLYLSRHDAAESCAVEAIDGPGARQRFELDRWQRHRPNDN